MLVEGIYVSESTKKTPSIRFDKSTGCLEISGRSLPEYAYGFYGDLFDVVDEYINQPQNKTKLIFTIDYFNSVSSKLIMQLIGRFETLLKLNKEVEVEWNYYAEDDMMIEVGQVYKSSTKIPVKLIELSAN